MFMLSRYLFCACLLTIAVQLVLGAEGSSRHDVAKKHVPLKYPSSNETGVLNQRKSLFARRGHIRHQKPMGLQSAAKPREPKPPRPPPAPPARRCPRVSDSCSPHNPCCDPCTTCHCRFFNTICYCWRLGRHCQLKS
ncbi:hypothetical protein SKAU_G00380680 [Synaphobranchus kaupii]|uniref:Agouti domain-containing protein n=1 Tax=Synaphobranchus kaupii TaxID=118154 RepID=A0A9Q1EDK7_SYNKA|nr:hypothetical protein SKAU_G00380680 [Synaphobranchus kaupii]